jgi:hypothetical protein
MTETETRIRELESKYRQMINRLQSMYNLQSDMTDDLQGELRAIVLKKLREAGKLELQIIDELTLPKEGDSCT